MRIEVRAVLKFLLEKGFDFKVSSHIRKIVDEEKP